MSALIENRRDDDEDASEAVVEIELRLRASDGPISGDQEVTALRAGEWQGPRCEVMRTQRTWLCLDNFKLTP